MLKISTYSVLYMYYPMAKTESQFFVVARNYNYIKIEYNLRHLGTFKYYDSEFHM